MLLAKELDINSLKCFEVDIFLIFYTVFLLCLTHLSGSPGIIRRTPMNGSRHWINISV